MLPPKEDIVTFDRRNAIHNAMSPLVYEDETWTFVLDAETVIVTEKHIQRGTCPILNALSEVAGEPLVNYAWGVARGQDFRCWTMEASQSDSIPVPFLVYDAKTPITSLTKTDAHEHGIGMYLLSSAVREWQLAYQERAVRHQKPVLPVTLVIKEAQRLIKIASEASF